MRGVVRACAVGVGKRNRFATRSRCDQRRLHARLVRCGIGMRVIAERIAANAHRVRSDLGASRVALCGQARP
ncbi:hypothetical protein WT83_21650 [Burkholderia territorii]|uniref:Uncharacterized protein n=1 Tax=Burkholderia territorii TaxID=1503055 RepID=A0A108EE13_9BURK|nr:hypothetical protein WT83_21650 [Burkholderia territorii]